MEGRKAEGGRRKEEGERRKEEPNLFHHHPQLGRLVYHQPCLPVRAFPKQPESERKKEPTRSKRKNNEREKKKELCVGVMNR